MITKRILRRSSQHELCSFLATTVLGDAMICLSLDKKPAKRSEKHCDGVLVLSDTLAESVWSESCQ